MQTWSQPRRTRPLILADLSNLEKAKHAKTRISAALVLVRSAALSANDLDAGCIRRRLISVLDELEMVEHFLGGITKAET